MFITPAYAQTGGAGSGMLELLFPIVIVGLIMWFLVIRPQRTQARLRAEMLTAVKRNDTIVTGGGIVAKVTKVIDDNEVEAEIAPGTKARIMRSMIAEVRVKGQPIAANDSGDTDAKKPAKKSRRKPQTKSPE